MWKVWWQYQGIKVQVYCDKCIEYLIECWMQDLIGICDVLDYWMDFFEMWVFCQMFQCYNGIWFFYVYLFDYVGNEVCLGGMCQYEFGFCDGVSCLDQNCLIYVCFC